ncbi:MAG: 2-oxoacid:acceptor oxidoreductase subunit alpha [Deinococcota bacterium]|nr:2-oxoacid:acceptor oxidoreductase subunit alpha [Deinococcota bacterium]
MKTNDLTLTLAGSGGDGVITTGDFIARAVAAQGVYCMAQQSYGPQIRGGESSIRVRMSSEPVGSRGDSVDSLTVFSWKDYQRFLDEVALRPGAVVMYEASDKEDYGSYLQGIADLQVFAVPFKRIAQEDIGVPLTKNMVALGVLSAVHGFDDTELKRAITDKYGKKRPEAAEKNLQAFEAGAAYAKEHIAGDFYTLDYLPKERLLFLNGDEALAYGALQAGVRYYAGYPITPATPILHWLQKELPRFGGTVIQAEDEISAVTQCLGASWSGVKAMTASAGPGISLMLEALGLSGMAEIPITIVNVQRVGPSTGIPSRPEQADFLQAMGGMHGDLPHAVFAPTDVEDCFKVALEAVACSERYQLPVIVLSDQYIGERFEAIDAHGFLAGVKTVERQKPGVLTPDAHYKRYEDTPSGVSPMAAPGQEWGQYITSGLEHDEYGAPTSSAQIHQTMSEKRARKLRGVAKDYDRAKVYGDNEADFGLICWGSVEGPVRQAVKRAQAEGLRVAAYTPRLLYPLPERSLAEFVKGKTRIVVLEMSLSGQFYHYLKGYAPSLPQDFLSLRRAGGNLFTVSEVLELIREHTVAEVAA